jgi:hypothetical protein
MMNRGLLAAGAVLLVGNALVLGGVRRNRAGNPDAVVRLSQRELEPWGASNDGSEVMLHFRLRWNMAPGPGGDGDWFDRARLEMLGVPNLPASDDTAAVSRWTRDTRSAYAVLELAGPAWERYAQAQQARADSLQANRPPLAQQRHAADRPWLEAEGARTSRLMAVDIGNDPAALRRQYPERSQYLILPVTYEAQVVPTVRDSLGGVTEPARLEGHITQLLPGTVHVPRPLRDSLLALGAAARDSTAHFEVTYKVGKRWEGWVE